MLFAPFILLFAIMTMNVFNLCGVVMKKKTKTFYVDTNELEKCWAHWLETEDPKSWENLQNDVYKICQGVAVRFNPRDEEEHAELSHHTFVMTIDKIKSRKLIFEPGRAPVFNLLTTTIFRHLYSLMNKNNRRRKLLLTKYLLRPGILDGLVSSAGIDGEVGGWHPDRSRIKSTVLSQANGDIKPTPQTK
jgi:hypothetical protein